MLEAIHQVKLLGTAGRAAPFVAIHVEDKRRPVKLLDQLAGCQTQDAQWPVAGAHDDHRSRIVEFDRLELRLAHDLRG